jgi:hypothetical protein
VYLPPLATTFPELAGRTRDAVATFTLNLLNNVSIAIDYGLDDRGSIPTEAEDCSSSLCVQTGSEAHPAPVQWVTGVLSPGVKRGWGVMLTTHPI